MSPNPPTQRRIRRDGPAGLQKAVLAQLRGAIIRGEYPPRNRLPSCRELSERFDINIMTMHRVLTFLCAEGFVVTRGSRGSFVVDKPPHLHRFALLFFEVPTLRGGPEAESPFATRLFHCALEANQSGAADVRVYMGNTHGSAFGDVNALLADAEAGRIAGIIFAAAFFADNEPFTSVIEKGQVPFVGISAFERRRKGHLDWVVLTRQELIDQAMEHARASGRKSIGVVAGHYHDDVTADLAMLKQSAARHGLRFENSHLIVASRDTKEVIRYNTSLLMQSVRRPDALIILEDSLTDFACAGLIDAGVRVPTELLVITHSNFSKTRQSLLPMVHLGFDSNQVLSRCMEVITRRRHGQEVPDPTRMPVVVDTSEV